MSRTVKQLARSRASAVASLKRTIDEAAIARGAEETVRLLCSPDVETAVRAFLDGEWVL